MKSLAFDLPASKKDGSCQEDLKGKRTECVFKGKEPSSRALYASTLSACNSLANKLSEVQQSLATEIETKEKSEAKCEAQKNVSRNLTKQLKRRIDALDRQKQETKTLKKEVITKEKEISLLQKELASKDDKIQNIRIKLDETRREKNNAQELTRYHRQKKSNVKDSQLNDDEGDSSHELNTKLKEYNDIIVEKDYLLNQLSEKVDELENERSSQPAVVTFVNGPYSDDVRVTCLELLSRNVGIQNVEPIIRSVSKNI